VLEAAMAAAVPGPLSPSLFASCGSVFVRVLWPFGSESGHLEGEMPKTDSSFNPDDYALVADRIALFYERFPTGRIVPHLHSVTRHAVIFEARVYRDTSETEPAAVGWARELEGDGDINEVACLENTETSAIGRALANLGFAASKRRPSYEEMMKADRVRRRLAVSSPAASSGRASLGTRRSDSPTRDDLQARADTALDIVRLVRTAERLGLGPERANGLVARVSEGAVSDRSLTRLERALRAWVGRREGSRFGPR
jgi:hypothetical protein